MKRFLTLAAIASFMAVVTTGCGDAPKPTPDKVVPPKDGPRDRPSDAPKPPDVK